MREELDAVNNLTLLEGSVSDLLITSPVFNHRSNHSLGRIQGIALGMSSLLKTATSDTS